MRYALLFLFAISLSGFAQPLRDINYNFQVDPAEPFTFHMKTVRTTEGWTAFYEFSVRDTVQRTDQFLFQWELRNTLDEKQGTPLEPASILKEVQPFAVHGTINLPPSAGTKILSVRVLNNVVKRVWIFYKVLDPNYPVNGYLTVSGKAVQEPYVKHNASLALMGEGTRIISHYVDDFPAAVPAFSEGMGRVARGMRVDTTFTIVSNVPTTFTQKGLYLVQADTSSAEGYAFRVEDDYPRLTKVESLADPLIYICTKQEFQKVKDAKGDKKAFDRAIIGITGNTERARNFMRNYFKRVEWANFYFTSYKEGWKTDRGMIYILFGLPEELYKFGDREVWTYKSDYLKATFTFVKSSTLFDPENYVLVREKKFQEMWYEKVDLWRSARF